MYSSNNFVALALFLTTSAWAEVVPGVAPRSKAPTPTTLGTAIGGALDPKATRPPRAGAARVQLPDGGPLTININNQYGSDLQIAYASNAGAPTPVGNPGPGTLASSTQLLLPSDWAGAITIGKNQDPQGSKIQASFVSAGDYQPDVDVTYVDGYTVPITCSCDNVVVTGCNKALETLGNTCPNQGDGICYNPQQGAINGPADPFFAPCQGAAYTFPGDSGANSFGQCNGGTINCCVGSSCPAPDRQPAKRGLPKLGRRVRVSEN